MSVGSASANTEGQLYHDTLCKRLEHLWILVSLGLEGCVVVGGGPGTNPPWIPRDNCISYYKAQYHSHLPYARPSSWP